MNEAFKRHIRVGLAAGVLCLALLVIPALPQGKAPSMRSSTYYNSIKGEIQAFESVLNKRLEQQFKHPLAIVDKPKGVYLYGYGALFTFLVNVNRASFKTPFGEHKIGELETPEQKKQRIQEVKEMVIKTLSDHAGALGQLSPRDFVVVVAHFEDNNELDELKKNKTVIIRASKKELDEHRAKPNYSEFRRRVEVLEY
jgi:hypothetical protein